MVNSNISHKFTIKINKDGNVSAEVLGCVLQLTMLSINLTLMVEHPFSAMAQSTIKLLSVFVMKNKNIPIFALRPPYSNRLMKKAL